MDIKARYQDKAEELAQEQWGELVETRTEEVEHGDLEPRILEQS